MPYILWDLSCSGKNKNYSQPWQFQRLLCPRISGSCFLSLGQFPLPYARSVLCQRGEWVPLQTSRNPSFSVNVALSSLVSCPIISSQLGLPKHQSVSDQQDSGLCLGPPSRHRSLQTSSHNNLALVGPLRFPSLRDNGPPLLVVQRLKAIVYVLSGFAVYGRRPVLIVVNPSWTDLKVPATSLLISHKIMNDPKLMTLVSAR